MNRPRDSRRRAQLARDLAAAAAGVASGVVLGCAMATVLGSPAPLWAVAVLFEWPVCAAVGLWWWGRV